MSDPTKGGLDDELRRSFRLATQEEFNDWTFSAELRSTVQRQVREQARVNVWMRAGRVARDAGWLVAAAAMVVILSGRGGLHLGDRQAPSTESAASASPSPTAATGSAGPQSHEKTVNTPPQAPATSDSMPGEAPPAGARALTTSTPATPTPTPAPTEGGGMGAAATGAAPAPTAPVTALTVPGSGMADATGEVVTAQDAESSAKGKTGPRGVAPVMPEGGRAFGVGAAPEPALVQTLPLPVPTKTQAIAKTLNSGEQGLALQALPNALILYVKTPMGPAVRSLDMDLQEQWSDNLDPLAAPPVLQSHGSQVIGQYTLVSQEGQFLLYDEIGTVRVRLTAGEGVTLRGVRLTGDRWLTLVGKTGPDTVVWVADLGQMRLLNAVRLTGQAVDAVALDAVHVAAIDAKGSLQLISLQP